MLRPGYNSREGRRKEPVRNLLKVLFRYLPAVTEKKTWKKPEPGLSGHDLLNVKQPADLQLLGREYNDYVVSELNSNSGPSESETNAIPIELWFLGNFL